MYNYECALKRKSTDTSATFTSQLMRYRQHTLFSAADRLFNPNFQDRNYCIF